jgi:hypothetical protein
MDNALREITFICQNGFVQLQMTNGSRFFFKLHLKQYFNQYSKIEITAVFKYFLTSSVILLLQTKFFKLL